MAVLADMNFFWQMKQFLDLLEICFLSSGLLVTVPPHTPEKCANNNCNMGWYLDRNVAMVSVEVGSCTRHLETCSHRSSLPGFNLMLTLLQELIQVPISHNSSGSFWSSTEVSKLSYEADLTPRDLT